MSGYAEVGWFGEVKHVHEYLDRVGADRDETGRYKLFRDPPTIGLCGQEIVIPERTEYSVRGERRNLSAGLNASGHGIGVRVF